MTDRLLELVVKDEGSRVWVRPEIVVEVAFNEIQRSSRYRCGMALRLARIHRIREDKSPRDIVSIPELREIYMRRSRVRGAI
jgi:DNA ligase-1